MNRLKQLIVVLGFVAFACSDENEPNVPALMDYSAESFPNLSVSIVEGLETPFESSFSSGGRVKHSSITMEEVVAKLQAIFPGAVIIEVQQQTERGLPVWEAKVKMAGGGIIKIKVVEDLGKIIKLKGKTGPFDYDFDPEGSFITFGEAKALALAANPGDLMSWSLELEEDNQWEYEFHIVSNSERVEVEVKGFATEVIAVKEKHEGDDDDNDGEEDESELEDEMEHGDDHNDHTVPTDNLTAFVAEIVDGTIVHSERHEMNGKVFWEVYVKNQAGAVIKVELKDEPLTLMKIEGEVGPFDYNVEPGGDVLDFTAILEIVFSEATGVVTEWRLDYEVENGEPRWRYEFRVQGEGVRYEMKINGITGEFIDFKEIN